MTDPFALLSMALAAGGGKVDQWPAGQLVAAGVTLLQRCAPLVRAVAGKRTAILLPTDAAFITALAASDGRGAVLVNPLASRSEIAWQLMDADVGAVFTNQALISRLPDGLPNRLARVVLDDAPRSATVLVNGTTLTIDLGSHFGLELHGDTDVQGRDEEAVIVYTSAMAGTPLGAILTHRNIIGNARATITAMHDSRDDHTLTALPLSHMFGLVVGATAPLFAGGRVTTMSRFSPTRALEIIEQQKVTRMIGVPSMYFALLSAIERRGRPMHAPNLRFCMCGGAYLNPEFESRWAEDTGIPLRQGYGLTETSPVTLLNQMNQPAGVQSLGTPIADVEVSIRQTHTSNRLGFNNEGEICVRGPNVFRGYVSSNENGLTVRDGWLHTGDLGVQRPDQSVEFRGLVKPMFTRNGFNIYPRELERAIGALDGVHAVRVSSAPDDVKENEIVVDVVGTVSQDDVKLWCSTELALYKQPSTISVHAT